MTSVEETGNSTWAIIPAAGSGERFGNRRDKLMATVGRIPILVRSVENILNSHGVTGAIVVIKKEQEILYRRAIDQYGHVKPVKFVMGGNTRQESVRKGMEALPENASTVLIHDAARPLNSKLLTEKLIKSLQENPNWNACIPGLPLTDTIKSIKTTGDVSIVEQTLDRTLLWSVQTPQVFKKAALLEACAKVSVETHYTDEAQLLELAEIGEVGLIKGDTFNLKITHLDDLIAAESLYQQVKNQL